jgi:hypothetical protein
MTTTIYNKELLPHVSRMLVERYQLYERVLALDKFITSDELFAKLPEQERHDMKDQLEYMQKYQKILERRIQRAEAS